MRTIVVRFNASLYRSELIFRKNRFSDQCEGLQGDLPPNSMKLYIKSMVGLPGKALVKEELERLNIPFGLIKTGVVEIPEGITPMQRARLKTNLLPLGLKLHEVKKGVLIEKIMNTILEMIQYGDGHPVLSYSVYLSAKLDYDYTYLANIFSEVNGFSIQEYIIFSKIEKVKELLFTGDISLSQISYNLHYSSVAHLSGQFKKVTGLSPTCYKSIRQNREELEMAAEVA